MSRGKLAAAREFATRVLDEKYETDIKDRLDRGVLPVQVEVLLLHYKFGKPVEEMVVSAPPDDLSRLSTEELVELTRTLERKLLGAPVEEAKEGATEQVH